ncbi:MAG: DctP family TRAP transporter solute-binding subunit [Deltaproteobacteria bacterium]|nr:DctP family TRAP transporter solute-binding subunit [Deltaproteobacteria bacterium]
MKKILTLVAVCMVLSAFPVGASEYKAEYRLSTVLGPAFPWGRAAERWASLVKEKTEGRINIKVYPGTSLVGGDQTREFTAIRQGVIDLAVGSSINWSPQIKQLNLFSLPFLVSDEKAMDAVTHGEVAKDIFAVLKKQGVMPLAIGENGFRELSNSKLAIKSPTDLKGLKIRVVGSPIFIDGFSALGANPTQMSWADAQPALATKAVDGQENPLSVFNAAKLHTVEQKYLTLWGYMADPLFFVVSQKVWDSWTEADRVLVAEAATQAAAENVVDARKGITAGDDALLREIEKNGVIITRLTAEEREPFRAATRPVHDKWAAIVGMDLVKKAEAAIAASR